MSNLNYTLFGSTFNQNRIYADAIHMIKIHFYTTHYNKCCRLNINQNG